MNRDLHWLRLQSMLFFWEENVLPSNQNYRQLFFFLRKMTVLPSNHLKSMFLERCFIQHSNYRWCFWEENFSPNIQFIVRVWRKNVLPNNQFTVKVFIKTFKSIHFTDNVFVKPFSPAFSLQTALLGRKRFIEQAIYSECLKKKNLPNSQKL